MGRLEPHTLDTTIQLLAQRWSQAEALLAAFPLLARGGPLAIAELARSTGARKDQVESAVEAGQCDRDAAGRLIGIYGMTLAPAAHRLEIDGRIVYCCCALWAHVLPKLVGETVRVESVDPIRRELIRLSISPDGLESVEPSGAAAVLVVTDREKLAMNVGAAFCSHVRHFVSKQSAQQFVEEDPARKLVGLPELQEAAEQLHRAIWAVTKG